jgi:hypothetical protein
MIDWDGLQRPLYDIQGADAVITLRGGASHAVKVIDHTGGIDMTFGQSLMPDIKPVCFLERASAPAPDLLADCSGASVLVNARTWGVRQVKPLPVDGVASGEVMLILINEAL